MFAWEALARVLPDPALLHEVRILGQGVGVRHCGLAAVHPLAHAPRPRQVCIHETAKNVVSYRGGA